MQSTTKLKGKRALITGAGTGIGRGIALEFAREGADIALHYSHDDDDYRGTLTQIRSNGCRAEAFKARFEKLDDVHRLADDALKFLGGLDILINNAGITMSFPFEKVTAEQFDLVYGVNVRAPFFLTQTCTPALIQSKGCIVNISSVHSLRGCPGHSVYAGTKGAMTAFSRELAIELSVKGVRVNTIVPGCVVVENYYKMAPDLDKKKIGHAIPSGFPGEPADIAHLAVFLSSPESRYIVGQTIVIDGGTTSWLAFGDAFRNPPGLMGQQYIPGME